MNTDILKYFKGDSTALPELKKAMAKCDEAKDTQFKFRGGILDRRYAQYLIEYLEAQTSAP